MNLVELTHTVCRM